MNMDRRGEMEELAAFLLVVVALALFFTSAGAFHAGLTDRGTAADLAHQRDLLISAFFEKFIITLADGAPLADGAAWSEITDLTMDGQMPGLVSAYRITWSSEKAQQSGNWVRGEVIDGDRLTHYSPILFDTGATGYVAGFVNFEVA